MSKTSILIGRLPGAIAWSLLLLFLGIIVLRTGDATNCRRRRSLAANNNRTIAHNLRLRLADDGRPQIPGLYDDIENVTTPVQGLAQFNELVLGIQAMNLSANCSEDTLKMATRTQVLSLVQFYMATCPDCQGFSRYFKRFAADVGPHWRALVRILVVNCNDQQNIYLCQEQNPRIIVPMVRWYKLPIIQRVTLDDLSKTRMSSEIINTANTTQTRLANNTCHLGFRKDVLSVAHRQFIDEERRDHIALRRATLKYALMMLDELTDEGDRVSPPVATTRAIKNRRLLYESLPAHWHQLEKLGRRSSNKSIEDEISVRVDRCLRDANSTELKDVKHFIVIEPQNSSIGLTIIADWSQLTCRFGPNKPLFLVHRSHDTTLTQLYPTVLMSGEHRLLHFDTSSIRPDELRKKLSLNDTANLRTRRDINNTRRLERIQQRASLERFYSSLGAQPTSYLLPSRYAAAMTATASHRQRLLHKREIATSNQKVTFELKSSSKEFDFNWKPESAYPNEEQLRFAFNQQIARYVNLTGQLANFTLPGIMLNGTHPGEIPKPNSLHKAPILEPKEDDLALLYLTDYYKGLDVIVHNDLLAKGELDGYQLLSSACFLHKLALYFPWQGNAHGSTRIGSGSIARHYIELLGDAWLKELRQALVHSTTRHNSSTSLPNKKLSTISFFDAKSSDVCTNLRGSSDVARAFLSLRESLEQMRIPARQLEAVQKKFNSELRIGLPPDKHLKWNYCAGSSPYLRSHTCSLWILFHTLSVHEYLASHNESSFDVQAPIQNRHQNQSLYEFQVDYSKPPLLACDAANPDNALIETPNSRLFVNSTRHVLANIINFVRFYLPCTNCAAHFSCMVNHSPGLSFDNSIPPDLHLLWLWEAHNRVNLRTRGTHSEDPARPKHIFPSFEACPECYLERPPSCSMNFTQMRFNRTELVKFLVARYRKIAILNNKLNIEDLFFKV